MPLQSASIVEDRYRVDRLLGKGGMGAVYRAWDQRLEQWVALKENIMTSADAQAQFEREAKVLARLRHPGLPRVIDHFVTKAGLQYLVMDYVDGVSLAELLRSQARFSPDDIRSWLSQVCDALAYLHGQNPPVIHRDIKPQNIKITTDGRVILVDFGLSKVGAAQDRTATGALGVTPGFSPPEQYGAGHTDERSDIYALAATLYALLTGETPPDSVQRAIQSAALVPPRRLNPAIGADLEGALMHGLATQPARRPPTVRDFEREVQQALSRTPVGVNLASAAAAAAISTPRSAPGQVQPSSPAATAAPVRPVSTPRPATAPPPAQGRKPPVILWFALGGALVVILLVLGAVLAIRGGQEPVPMPVAVAPATVEGAAVYDPTSTLAAGARPTATEEVTPDPGATEAGVRSGSTASGVAVTASGATREPPVASAAATPKPAATATPSQPTQAPSRTPRPTAVPTNTASVAPTVARAAVAVTPCPPYLHQPRRGMGLLLIENHLGEPLHIDRTNSSEKWDLPPKSGDVPGRLVLDLPPGRHVFVDNTAVGGGHITIDVAAGGAYVSPIWYNNRSEELVYPLEIPNGCR